MISLSQHEYQELNILSSAYWYEVDVNHARDIGQYWTDNSILRLGSSTFDGRDAIEKFYEWRRQREQRVSLHLFSGLVGKMISKETCEIYSILTLYAADGIIPLTGTIPVVVGTARDICVRNENGKFKYQQRLITNVFESGAEVTLPNSNISSK